eukprot:tig00021037_g17439.t1
MFVSYAALPYPTSTPAAAININAPSVIFCTVCHWLLYWVPGFVLLAALKSNAGARVLGRDIRRVLDLAVAFPPDFSEEIDVDVDFGWPSFVTVPLLSAAAWAVLRWRGPGVAPLLFRGPLVLLACLRAGFAVRDWVRDAERRARSEAFGPDARPERRLLNRSASGVTRS